MLKQRAASFWQSSDNWKEHEQRAVNYLALDRNGAHTNTFHIFVSFPCSEIRIILLSLSLSLLRAERLINSFSVGPANGVQHLQFLLC